MLASRKHPVASQETPAFGHSMCRPLLLPLSQLPEGPHCEPPLSGDAAQNPDNRCLTAIVMSIDDVEFNSAGGVIFTFASQWNLAM